MLQLTRPYWNKGYNITADNFFTQLPIILDLKKKKTTYVGTVRNDRREIPPAAIQVKGKSLFESTFLIEENGVLLTSYKVKPSKNVVILSSRHEYGYVPDINSVKKKANTVLFYNSTKFGVDSLDQMCKHSTVKSGVRRWPLACFFNMLDLLAINSYILYKNITGKTLSRRKFILMLVEDLLGDNKKMPQEKTTRKRQASSISTSKPKRRKCFCCDNKTLNQCSCCHVTICGQCSAERTIIIKCSSCVK